MVLKSGTKDQIIFEHKTWSHLHEKQLDNYRLSSSAQHLVLITASNYQHTQKADNSLIWSEIYTWIEKHHAQCQTFAKKEFLALLEAHSLGNLTPVSLEKLQNYPKFEKNDEDQKDVEADLKNLLMDVLYNHYSCFQIDKRESLVKTYPAIEKIRRRWGRYGFDFWDDHHWKPSIFVGFILDGKDHGVNFSNADLGPDCCIILSFEKELHQTYPDDKNYQNLINRLLKTRLPDGWKLFNQIEENKGSSKLNRFHPIIIRKPAVQVLAKTDDINSQAKRFADELSKVLEILLYKGNEVLDMWKMLNVSA